MLDITSYRRKQKYVLPLTVMRQFYHDYERTMSIRPKIKKNAHNNSTEIDPLARQTLSIQKFQKCLNKIQNYQHCQSQCRNTADSEQKYMRQNKINSTCDGVVKNNKSKLSLKKMTVQDDVCRKQTGYFKQMLSSTVAFLKCHPCIQKSKAQKTGQPQPQQKPLSSQCIPFSLNKLRVRNPTRLFLQMQQEKQNQEQTCIKKKNRLRKVRENYIIENLYRNCQNLQNPHNPHNPHKQQEDLAVGKSALNTFRVRSQLKVREEFRQTQENIFPH